MEQPEQVTGQAAYAPASRESIAKAALEEIYKVFEKQDPKLWFGPSDDKSAARNRYWAQNLRGTPDNHRLRHCMKEGAKGGAAGAVVGGLAAKGIGAVGVCMAGKCAAGGAMASAGGKIGCIGGPVGVAGGAVVGGTIGYAWSAYMAESQWHRAQNEKESCVDWTKDPRRNGVWEGLLNYLIHKDDIGIECRCACEQRESLWEPVGEAISVWEVGERRFRSCCRPDDGQPVQRDERLELLCHARAARISAWILEACQEPTGPQISEWLKRNVERLKEKEEQKIQRLYERISEDIAAKVGTSNQRRQQLTTEIELAKNGMECVPFTPWNLV